MLSVGPPPAERSAMHEYFPNKPPRRDPTPEAKTRMARKFRRWAKLADGLFLLMVLCLLVGAVFPCWEEVFVAAVAVLIPAELLVCGKVFFRCPCCGRISSDWHGLGLFFWRDFECPVCGFMAEWGR